MCANPANEQVYLFFAEGVVADHSVIVPTNIKYGPVTTVAQQVSCAECIQNILRSIPIGTAKG